MTPDAGERIFPIFRAALELDRGARARYLEEACHDDPELRAEVEALLAGEGDEDAPFGEPALAAHRAGLDQLAPGQRKASAEGVPADRESMPVKIGEFRVLRRIGKGGMGIVYEAEQENPRRHVAVKVLRPTAMSGKHLARFQHEAQVLGRLTHPGIAQIYEAGTFDQGDGPQPFFAMELVSGESLLEWSRHGERTLTERLDVFIRICDAIQHAHLKGVVHRDLKPENVLVTAGGRPKVLDFGVARAVDSDVQLTTMHTEVGQLIGTVAYMSPEQAGGDASEIDARSDIYTLGVLLFQLLADRLPHNVEGRSIPEAVRAIQQDEPTSLGSTDTKLRGDLETIVRRALEKEPGRRYSSATELGADIARYLANEPILARRPSAIYQLRKFAGRNRGLVAGIALAVLALAVGLVFSIYFAFGQVEQRARADRERANVMRLSAFQTLEDLEASARTLWPAEPENLETFDEWLDDARELVAGLPGHREQLAALEERARAEATVISSADAENERWWRLQLVKLVDAVEAFADPATGLVDGVSAEFGWGVGKRRAWADAVEQRTVSGAEAAALWSEAVAAIAAEPLYGGLVLEPQRGLLPLGPDRDSELWEFGHLLSGEPAERGRDGLLVLKEETGLVFVLLPGGTFTMGSQRRDPNGLNYDPRALPDEIPLHEVELSPFFLSKYELTQAQWLRFTATNPSTNRVGQVPMSDVASLLHPVEQVNWHQAMEATARMGLVLPTEAQWEYAARAGTSTVWWTGDEREWLMGSVNLADQAANRAGALWPDIAAWPELDDGARVHMPVGSYFANPFGLHDMQGNAWEWCRDGFDREFYARSPSRDPVREPDETTAERVARSGSFRSSDAYTRSAYRHNADPTDADFDLGLRPARALTRFR